ncbi:NAD-dependent epimerase/dehydratase family protein [Ruicaihuangia caeni]|uniref:NAD(P)-dependent oxidoreductase n=1 Tax=Ruicaihuangia caeni TaxID=3042517 RepID=A0AAW6T712_9MICO|nr:NAD(P)-dependent oxidoreductase [Klugiella sp. YN-L-19]MDI2098881.1 NAD(P)-dependent oxidoreductase [Klugiella sp. YN-L-19]
MSESKSAEVQPAQVPQHADAASEKPGGARSVLVTGGNGFIGAWVVKNLLERGHRPIVFDVGAPSPLITDLLGERLNGIEWLTGDIRDAAQVSDAVSGVDAVVHLAGVLTPFCNEHPVTGAEINVIGTVNVLDAARRHGIAGVSYASSAAVYSSTALDLNPRSLYGAYKLAAEFTAKAFCEQFGLNSMGLRPLVVYGPGRESGASAGIALACRAAARGESYEIPLHGRTDAVYVADVADAFVVSALEPLDGAHSCSIAGTVVDIDDVVRLLGELVPGSAISRGTGDLGIHAEVGELDLRARRDDVLRTELRDGLEQTIAYYRH